MGPILQKFERNTIFTEQEAWMLFRIAAIGEACGWTMLITGIVLSQYVLPGNRIPVLIAGQIHGMLFFAYMVATLGLYPNLKWSRKKAFFAFIASVPPYGSLVFERWAGYIRSQKEVKEYSRYMLWSLMVLQVK